MEGESEIRVKLRTGLHVKHVYSGCMLSKCIIIYFIMKRERGWGANKELVSQ